MYELYEKTSTSAYSAGKRSSHKKYSYAAPKSVASTHRSEPNYLKSHSNSIDMEFAYERGARRSMERNSLEEYDPRVPNSKTDSSLTIPMDQVYNHVSFLQ